VRGILAGLGSLMDYLEVMLRSGGQGSILKAIANIEQNYLPDTEAG